MLPVSWHLLPLIHVIAVVIQFVVHIQVNVWLRTDGGVCRALVDVGAQRLVDGPQHWVPGERQAHNYH